MRRAETEVHTANVTPMSQGEDSTSRKRRRVRVVPLLIDRMPNCAVSVMQDTNVVLTVFALFGVCYAVQHLIYKPFCTCAYL